MEIYKQRDYDRLKASLSINSVEIGEELEKHPAMLQEVGEFLARAIAARDDATALYDLAIVAASADLRDTEGRKPPETQIKAEAPFAPGPLKAAEDVADMKFSAQLWQTLFGSMIAKGSSLKRIAELTASGYMAPRATYTPEQRDEVRTALRKRREPIKERP